MSEFSQPGPGTGDPSNQDQGAVLLSLYDRALPQVYGYLSQRCGNRVLAEDLTSETFMAAVDAVRRQTVTTMTVGWLVAVARYKLVDHWRSRAREERKLELVEIPESIDDWDERLDALRAHATLAELAPQYRAALTLRYLDGLPVADVAHHLERTVHGAEALLVRARTAFRAAYGAADSDGEGPTT